jgi:hypothetical protein
MHFHYIEASQIQPKAGNSSLFVFGLPAGQHTPISRTLGNPINFNTFRQICSLLLLFELPGQQEIQLTAFNTLRPSTCQ